MRVHIEMKNILLNFPLKGCQSPLETNRVMDVFLKEHRVIDSRRATHLSLTGGKYEIRSNLQLFRELYTLSKTPMYLIERTLYPSRFFMDIDKCPLRIDTLLLALNQIQDRFIVCSCEHQDALHLIFKDVVVETPSAAIKLCQQICSRVPFLSEFVDTSVYYSGLRMIGSHKSATVARKYHVHGSSVLACSDLEACSIHHGTNGTPHVKAVVPQSIPSSMVLDLSDFDSHYKTIRIKSIKKTSDNKVYIISDSRYCTNINKHHCSKNAYFIVDMRKKEMVQRCLCKCAAKSCKSYSSVRLKMKVRDFYAIETYVSNIKEDISYRL
jgi:hypothetical protein